MPMPRVTADTLRAAIEANGDVENSVLMTDGAPMYTKIGRDFATANARSVYWGIQRCLSVNPSR